MKYLKLFYDFLKFIINKFLYDCIKYVGDIIYLFKGSVYLLFCINMSLKFFVFFVASCMNWLNGVEVGLVV